MIQYIVTLYLLCSNSVLTNKTIEPYNIIQYDTTCLVNNDNEWSNMRFIKSEEKAIFKNIHGYWNKTPFPIVLLLCTKPKI